MKKIILALLTLIFIGGAHVALAASEYTPLVTVGDVTTSGTPVTFSEYVSKAYTFAIGFAFVLAVVILVISGFRYMASEAFTDKEDAKKRIWAALIGILIVISAYLLLNTINPDLIDFKLNIILPVTVDSTQHVPTGDNSPLCGSDDPQPEAPGWYLRTQVDCQNSAGSTAFNIKYAYYFNTEQSEALCNAAITDPTHQRQYCVFRADVTQDTQPTTPGWWIKLVHGVAGQTNTILYRGPFTDTPPPPAGDTAPGYTCRSHLAEYTGYSTKECIEIKGTGEYCYYYTYKGFTTGPICGFRDPNGSNSCKAALLTKERALIGTDMQFDAQCTFNHHIIGSNEYFYMYYSASLGHIDIISFPTADTAFNKEGVDYKKCDADRIARIDTYLNLFTHNSCVIKGGATP